MDVTSSTEITAEDVLLQSGNRLWVFGYGSLCWNPGFEYRRSAVGFIHGFQRRFWQGNSTHRGIPGRPGRVATLVEDGQGKTWGKAFELCGEDALRYLDHREGTLGGYRTCIATFQPTDAKISSFLVLLYTATPENTEWLGPAPLPEVARQITLSRGANGHNVEYLVRLAMFMRESFPDVQDDHLYTLEALVLVNVQKEKLCLKQLMGDLDFEKRDTSRHFQRQQTVHNHHASPANVAANVPSFEYISRVPSKQLRCLNL